MNLILSTLMFLSISSSQAVQSLPKLVLAKPAAVKSLYAVVLVSGFLSSAYNVSSYSKWLSKLNFKYIDTYVLLWDSVSVKTLRNRKQKTKKGAFLEEVRKRKQIADKTASILATKLLPAIISKYKRVLLYGHSMGGRIVMKTLEKLNKPVIAVVAGSGIKPSELDWDKLKKHTIYNLYNPKDRILLTLYRSKEKPIGLTKLKDIPSIIPLGCRRVNKKLAFLKGKLKTRRQKAKAMLRSHGCYNISISRVIRMALLKSLR